MTLNQTPTDAAIARQGRIIALVIAGTVVMWLGANAVGAMLGLPGRYALLFDLAALAAFVWAFVNIYDIWRKRRNQDG